MFHFRSKLKQSICSFPLLFFKLNSSWIWFISYKFRKGTQFESLTSFCGMKQLIVENYVWMYRPSCINFIFTNQRNLIMESRIHATLHLKCHHQIIYSKLSLEKEYPQPYVREVWDYGKVQFDLISVTIRNFDSDKLLSGHNIRNQIKLFYKTILNIFEIVSQIWLFCAMIRSLLRLLIKRKNVMIQTQI